MGQKPRHAVNDGAPIQRTVTADDAEWLARLLNLRAVDPAGPLEGHTVGVLQGSFPSTLRRSGHVVHNITSDRQERSLFHEVDIGFPDGRTVDVRELDSRHWELLKQFEYVAQKDHYVISAGQPTDFASVPRIFVWFIPTYGKYTKAAILHDYLCDLAKADKFSRRDADGVFRQAMRILDVAFLRRWIMWAAVRWGALFTPAGRKGWLRDAWLVILISIPVLAIVGPAAALVFATLLIWYVIEVAFWIPLELARLFKAKRNKHTKRVNVPRLSLRL